jgi:protein-S-isoprenylcysteine O-methyltransferase Ste14
MKMKQPIDLHKGLTAFVVIALMANYDNWSIGGWVYLACHGTYGLMWVLKSKWFPDSAWEIEIPFWKAVGIFLALLLYWVAPVLLISSGAEPGPTRICLSVFAVIFGTFLHFGSDAQKHWTLMHRKGLITDGFFSRTRNPNYLGEILIYGGFCLLSMHAVPWLILGLFVAVVFVPNMRKKDRSISRHKGWAEYESRSGLLFPKFK